MTEITINEWRRGARHHGYANLPDGSTLGWVDLATGSTTLKPECPPEQVDAVVAQLLTWAAERGVAAPNAPDAEPASPHPASAAPVHEEQAPEPAEVPEDEWTDLSINRPGEGVRTEASAAWDASKENSKFLAYGARLFNVHTQERAWRVGADGEEAIGARLNKLRDRGWHVLHSIPVGTRGSDIDHVAIGPGGVFTLNSKNHPGGKIWVAKYQMRVNGHVVDYLRNARFEAERASKMLTRSAGIPVAVRSCVVVLTGTVVPEIKIKEMPDDVMVLDRMDIPKIFNRSTQRLTSEGIDEIYELGRRSTTWRL